MFRSIGTSVTCDANSFHSSDLCSRSSRRIQQRRGDALVVDPVLCQPLV
jgi:hypothetical protein